MNNNLTTSSFTNLNIRIDKEIKKSAEDIFTEMGMNMTTAVTMFLKQTVRDRRFPFVADLNGYNSETILAVEEGRRIANDLNVSGYKDITDLRKALEV